VAAPARHCTFYSYYTRKQSEKSPPVLLWARGWGCGCPAVLRAQAAAQQGTTHRRQRRRFRHLNQKLHHKGNQKWNLLVKASSRGALGLGQWFSDVPRATSTEWSLIIFSSEGEKSYREARHITQCRLRVPCHKAKPLSVRSATTPWIPGAICAARHGWRIGARDCRHFRWH